MTWSRVRLHLSNILQFLCNASKRVKKCVIIVIYCRPFIFYVHSTSSEQLDTNNSHSCNFFFFKLASELDVILRTISKKKMVFFYLILSFFTYLVLYTVFWRHSLKMCTAHHSTSKWLNSIDAMIGVVCTSLGNIHVTSRSWEYLQWTSILNLPPVEALRMHYWLLIRLIEFNRRDDRSCVFEPFHLGVEMLGRIRRLARSVENE